MYSSIIGLWVQGFRLYILLFPLLQLPGPNNFSNFKRKTKCVTNIQRLQSKKMNSPYWLSKYWAAQNHDSNAPSGPNSMLRVSLDPIRNRARETTRHPIAGFWSSGLWAWCLRVRTASSKPETLGVYIGGLVGVLRLPGLGI